MPGGLPLGLLLRVDVVSAVPKESETDLLRLWATLVCLGGKSVPAAHWRHMASGPTHVSVPSWHPLLRWKRLRARGAGG